jgi:transposase
MSRAPRLSLNESQQKLLEKWSRGGSTPYRLVVRSRIVLLAARGNSNRKIAANLGINPITVARWRSRFLVFGVEGIRHEAPRLGSPPRVSGDVVREILRKTSDERPPPSGRWSTRALARAVGVSHSTVRRVWKAYDVRPARSLVASIARDSRFRRKSIDVVGLYVNPPRRALAISLRDVDPPRSKPPVGGHAAPAFRPAGKGRSWMADLVSTLAMLDDRELKGSSHRHVDPEFLSFLRSVQERRKGSEQIQLFAESAGSDAAVPLTRWLRRHPEFLAESQVGQIPLTRLVVEWFSDASAPVPADIAPASLPGLRMAVEHWARESTDEPRPFAWTRK